MIWPFKKKIGLVLGGGVARGLAHVGVLKVIERNQIPIHCISAASSGSLVASAFAAGMEVRLIEEIALRISWGKIVRVTFFRPGFVSGEAIQELVIKYIGNKKFSELKIPLAIIATEIKSGKPVVIDRGRVAKAVAASSAFPGVFAPEELNHQFLVDGGLSDNLPVDAVRDMGANFVVASDVTPSHPIQYQPKDPFQVFGRSLDIILHKFSEQSRGKADILVEPVIDEDIWHLDLHKAKRLIAAGEVAAQQALRRLRRSFL
jgi:NTE family protein